MGKIACVFPGQGSQSVGMGKELFEAFPQAKSTFETIDELAGRSLTTLCFDGPVDELKRTINTQPTIMSVSLAAWSCYQDLGGPKPDFVAGHSLGEISALVASGAMSVEDAVKLVERRAQLMENCPEGAMAAVLKLAPEKLESICEEVSKELGSKDNAIVVMANFNTREQLVISGNPVAVKEASARAKEQGGRAIPLPVGGAFHSPLMDSAQQEFSKVLASCNLKDADCQVVQNFDARGDKESSQLRAKLDKQMVSPVRWYESVEYMIENGVDTFVEIGPGNVLTGLVKKIAPECKTFNISDAESLKTTIEELKTVACK